MSKKQQHSAQRINGAAHAGAGADVMQVNPVEVARTALMFLSRCDLKPYERSAFATCEAFLQGIATGQLTLAAAPVAPAAPSNGKAAEPPALA